MRVLAARAAARTQLAAAAQRRRCGYLAELAVRAQPAVSAVIEAMERRALLSTSIPLSSVSWTSVGPAPISDAAAGMPAGRITGIAADPADPNRLVVAAAGGGVWRTLASSSGWSPQTDAQATLVMGAVAIAPSNPNVIYAGTGEADNTADSSYGRGILKSMDGGNSWTLLGTTEFDRRSIARIAIDPTNANVVYVAISGGVNSASGNRGIWKSIDGGATWTNTTTSISPSVNYSDVVLNPSSPQIIYAAVGTSAGSLINGVYQSIDSGATWSVAGDFPVADVNNGRVRIAVSPSSPTTLYASITNATTGGLYKLLKSADGGAHFFELTNTPNYLGNTGAYNTALTVDPTNPNIVYAAGGAGANSIIRSADGGNTWSDIHTAVTGTSPHGGHFSLSFDASGKLLDGNDGGIWRLDNSTPGAIAWTSLNKLAGGSALGITQLNSVATHPTSANVAYGGAQANGTLKFNDSLLWSALRSGDNGIVRVDPATPATLYHVYARTGAGGTAGTGFLERSDDGGASWLPKTSGISATDPASLYVPYTLAPENPSRLLLGTNRVYESTNRGDSWTAISTPNANGWNTSATIDALASARTDPNTIYATAAGHVFVTTNHGASWTQRDIPGYSDHLKDLLVDSTNSQIVYAVRDRFTANAGGDGHVFVSTDGGASWTDLTASSLTPSGFPDLPVMSIDIHPRGPGTADDVIYVGTDAGVYAEDFSSPERWVKLGAGLPNAQVTDLEVNVTTRSLTAATHGRGVWQLQLDLPGSISGKVFKDFDADQTLDANEAALSGINVYLDANNNGALDAGETSTTTSATGDYSFTNLVQATYNVRQVTPAGYVCATPAGSVHTVEISNGLNVTGKNFTEFPITYGSSAGNDTYSLKINPSNGAQVMVIETVGASTSNYLVARTALSDASATLTFNSGAGDDMLTIDYSWGVPYASNGGVVFIGGAESTTAGDRLILAGSSGPDSFTIIQTAITSSGAISYAQLESIQLDTLAGNDTVTVSGAVSTPLAFTTGPGSNSVNLSGGFAWALNQDATAANGSLAISVSNGSAVTFNATQHLRSLIVGPAASAAMTPSGGRYLQTTGLSIAADSRLDLNDNDFILDYTNGLSGSNPYTLIDSWVTTGYSASPDPSRKGIVSTTSQNSPGVSPILALFDNFFIGAHEWPPGSGNALPEKAVVGKYTFFGDVNIDGQVTGDDYTIIDSNLGVSPFPFRYAWLAGDANRDLQVSGDDYTVIDARLGLGVGNPI